MLSRFWLLLALSAPVAARAGGESAVVPDTVETLEVKRAQPKEPKHASLQFLKDNRVFIRSQLDLLRLQVKHERIEGAEMLDPRYLRLQQMSAEIAAARDSVRGEEMRTSQRELLASVTQLGRLEGELNQLDSLITDQRRRLLALEKDFIGHQETALVILIKGLPGQAAPAAIELSEENDVVRIELTSDQITSLEQGGIAQVYHEFVEPREHVFSVTFDGGKWTGTTPVDVSVATARDRLTFLELDLGGLDRDREALGLLSSVWYR